MPNRISLRLNTIRFAPLCLWIPLALSSQNSPLRFDVPAPCSQEWATRQGTQSEAIRFGRKCLRRSADHPKLSREAVYQGALDAIPPGHPLLSFTPEDAAVFCLRYPSLNQPDRRVFWATLITAIAKQESHFDPMALLWEGPHDPEFSIGLLQISPSNKRAYQCDFASEDELTDPAHNLRCGGNILTKLVQRGHQIGGGDAKAGKSGAAKYWSTLRIVSEKPSAAGKDDTRSLIIADVQRTAACTAH
jgi:hypothetical protein